MKNITGFKLLAFLFSMMVLAQASFAQEIKFVQITDSHFSTGKGDYTQRDVENSQKVLEKTIKDVNEIKNLDFVVFTGDNIDQANPDDLKVFLKIANKLNVPYYVVIGNHEVFKSQNLTKKDYMQIVSKYSKSCKEKNPNYVFKKKGLVFVVVDGAKQIIPGPAGYYKKDTLTWFDKMLTKYKDDKVVVFQHFPIVEPYYNRSHTTYNKQDYEAVLKKHTNVIAIVSGHFHANGECKKDGIYHISTPALVEPPNNYKVIEIKLDNKTPNDNTIYTQLRHAE